MGELLKERPNVVQRDVLLVKLNLFVTARAGGVAGGVKEGLRGRVGGGAGGSAVNQ